MCLGSHDSHAHFKGKNAIGHVIEAQAQGLTASSEIHGTEAPGHISAGADAARETALLLLLMATILIALKVDHLIATLTILAFSLAFWKLGRSALLGWNRLERLHRILAQEKWEIEHHRKQERAELAELYRAKGFEGELLENVLDVLMADDNRLLRVMVEEELGLSLNSHEHPLKQGFGALIGSLLASLLFILALTFFSFPVALVVALLVVASAGAVVAKYSQNRIIPSMIWSSGLAIFSLAILYFFLQPLSPL